jgi:hypothetical protein
MGDQLELMPLRPSVARPQEPIVRGATIEGCFRFDLTRAWGSGGAVAWVMLNPSTADGLQDDPTIRNIMCRSMRWGFGSLVVVNIYPFRSPSPKVLQRWRAGGRSGHTVDNARRAYSHMQQCDAVIAAWGAHANSDDVAYLLDRPTFEPQRFSGVDLHCLGLTRSGAPLHPLARGKHWVPMDRKPVPFKFEFPEETH